MKAPAPEQEEYADVVARLKSHPFMDGTKRTAFASAIYFLGERGYRPCGPLPMDEIIPDLAPNSSLSLRLRSG